MKILLLEDDVILSEIIEEFLLELGYEVEVCFDGEEAVTKAYSQTFDLLLLDVNVPLTTGIEFLTSLRQNNNTTPAIFITSLNTSADLENGFNAGCDDYIKKPFELQELNLRINNIKRIYKLDNTDIIKIDENTSFDSKNNKLKKDDKEISVTKKEADILKYLLNNKSKAISIDELSNNIWSYEDTPSPSTIRTYIKNIRKYIGQDCITNIKGVGYKFN